MVPALRSKTALRTQRLKKYSQDLLQWPQQFGLKTLTSFNLDPSRPFFLSDSRVWGR